jgi:hypothetical protein
MLALPGLSVVRVNSVEGFKPFRRVNHSRRGTQASDPRAAAPRRGFVPGIGKDWTIANLGQVVLRNQDGGSG